jgi:hypothetical protein
VSTAIIGGLLVALTTSAFAVGPPKTKAKCEKFTDMTWAELSCAAATRSQKTYARDGKLRRLPSRKTVFGASELVPCFG